MEFSLQCWKWENPTTGDFRPMTRKGPQFMVKLRAFQKMTLTLKDEDGIQPLEALLFTLDEINR
jgi:hypothetical protein